MGGFLAARVRPEDCDDIAVGFDINMVNILVYMVSYQSYTNYSLS